MSGQFWMWAAVGGVVLVLALLFLLDAVRQKQRRERQKHMTPEEREIARREAKVFQGVFRRKP